MSRKKATLPPEREGSTEGDADAAEQTDVPARHSYNLRNIPRKNWAATEPKVAESRSAMPGVGVGTDSRSVGGHDEDNSAPPSEVGEESEASSAERSDDLFGESGDDSEMSGDWAESRSRITTPDSSTPASPKRRQGVGDEVLQRPTIVNDAPVAPNRPHLRGERLGEVPGHRRAPPAATENADPVDLEARSTQLIEQLQQYIRDREDALASPRNDPHTSGGRLAPREAEARLDGRHGPQTSQSFGRDPAEPGTGRSPAAATRFSDNSLLHNQ